MNKQQIIKELEQAAEGHWPKEEAATIARYLYEDWFEGLDFSSERLSFLLGALAEGRPWQYLSGRVEFLGRCFRIDERALIPRPETEAWLGQNLKPWSKFLSAYPCPNLADLGTGSGCLGLSMAAEWPRARVFCNDYSPQTLVLAQENARNLGLSEQIDFEVFNALLSNAWPSHWPLMNLIVSNPPYIPEVERPLMSASTLRYEPSLALFTDNWGDALVFYRAYAAYLPSKLAQDGRIALEINEFWAKQCLELFQTSAWTDLELLEDYWQKPRCLLARKAN